MRKHLTRRGEIERIRLRIERDSWPRLQMSLLVLITGASGFIASYWLFSLGMVQMWSRYLATFGIAYLVFLLLLWLWLRQAARDYDDLADTVDVVDAVTPRSDYGGGYDGGGGDFGGGGGSGSWSSPSSGGSDSSAVDLFDADIVAIPLALIALVAGLLVCVFFVISSAPVLFAELIVDGVLAASLYRRLRGLEPSHWLEPALHRTFLPFVLTAILVSVTGWEMERHAPGAHTIAQVLHPALRDPV